MNTIHTFRKIEKTCKLKLSNTVKENKKSKDREWKAVTRVWAGILNIIEIVIAYKVIP